MHNKSTRNIIIYGSGGLGRGIIELVHSINMTADEQWKIQGIIDDYNDNNVYEYPYLGDIKYLLNLQERTHIVIAFGNPKIKYEKYQLLKCNKNLLFPNLIHPGVSLPQTLSIGKGNIISSGVSLSADVKIGNFNLIHFNSTIGHDVFIENYNSIYPLTSLSGYVHIHNGVEVGSNATIIPSKSVKDNSIVGAGSVVLENVEENQTVAGVPSRIIKFDNEGRV